MKVRPLLTAGVLTGLAALMVAWSPLMPQADPQAGGAGVAEPEIAEDDLIGYGVGFYLGNEVRQGLEFDGVEADIDLLIEGFSDGLRNDRPDIDKRSFEAVLQRVHLRMQERTVQRLLAEDEEYKKIHDDNLARSLAYHEAHKDDPETVTLPSGVQYTVIVEGNGPVPKVSDTVIITGKGQLVDGPLFADVENFEMNLWEATEGAREILSMMPVGSTWHVAIPPHKAYGAGGGPPNIGPNETLLLRVELVGIKEDVE